MQRIFLRMEEREKGRRVPNGIVTTRFMDMYSEMGGFRPGELEVGE
jgi:hypothetical protein